MHNQIVQSVVGPAAIFHCVCVLTSTIVSPEEHEAPPVRAGRDLRLA